MSVLAETKLLPDVQANGWNDFWNTKNWIYVVDIHQGMSTQWIICGPAPSQRANHIDRAYNAMTKIGLTNSANQFA